MSVELAVAAAMFAGVIAYALFGGADFGTGFYDLTAGGTRRGAELRTQVDHSIGPVWEANHVWLIYVMVMWWTGFPQAFAAAMNTLILPMLFALLGIVLRGGAFAFRKYAATLTQARLFGAIFATSSLITPFFLGAAVGAIVSGRVPIEGRGEVWGSWLHSTSILGGLLAVGTSSFLAGTFLVADATRAGHLDLGVALRMRTIGVGIATGSVALLGLVPLRLDAPTLWDGLLGRALPMVMLSALAGVATLALLWMRRYRLARITAVLAVFGVVVGWGLAQYPWMLVDQIRVVDAAGAPATLRALLVAVAIAAVIVGPALGYLYTLTQSPTWTDSY